MMIVVSKDQWIPFEIVFLLLSTIFIWQVLQTKFIIFVFASMTTRMIRT